jgi:hypothetical protein
MSPVMARRPPDRSCHCMVNLATYSPVARATVPLPTPWFCPATTSNGSMPIGPLRLTVSTDTPSTVRRIAKRSAAGEASCRAASGRIAKRESPRPTHSRLRTKTEATRAHFKARTTSMSGPLAAIPMFFDFCAECEAASTCDPVSLKTSAALYGAQSLQQTHSGHNSLMRIFVPCCVPHIPEAATLASMSSAPDRFS